MAVVPRADSAKTRSPRPRPVRPRAGGRTAARGRGAALIALGLALGCGGGPPPLPNLVLLTADSLRADRLSCYGGPAGAGESICALGQRGTRFVWALSPSSEGGPAAASLLTSRLPSDHGLEARPSGFLPSEQVSVAEVLEAAGYRTAAFVSSPELLRSRNLDQGFGVYDDRLEREPNAPPARSAAHTLDAALPWIDATSAPWAVWIHFGDLHGPYPPPAIPDYETYRERQSVRLGRIDAAVGRLVAHLESHGVSAEVVFAGLHGEAAGEDGHWFEHGHSLGLEQLRVPLLWARPEPSPPRVVPNAVSTLDVAPTWLRLAGAETPEGSEGVPLPRAADPPPAPGTRSLFAESPDQRAVNMGRFFYVRGRFPRLGARIAKLPEDGALPVLGPVDGPGLRTRMESMERQLAERRRPDDRLPGRDSGKPLP